MAEPLKEGTLVRIIRYANRPEFEGKEAEIGNYSEKDGSYECWLTEDSLEGAYALCKREDFEVPEAPPVQAPVAKDSEFAVGDRVKGKETGKLGIVVSVDSDGDPKVRLDGETDALQRFGSEFEVVEKACFNVGDRVRGKETGKLGTVVSVDADGDPKVRLDGETEDKQRFGKEFEIVEKYKFGIGDRVRGKDSGKIGTVVSLDGDGDPKVKLDGEDEAQQRFGKEFEIVEKNFQIVTADNDKKQSRSRSRSDSDDKKGKKKKKKKKKGSSSSSESSSSRRSNSSNRPRGKKRSSAFEKSALEKAEDEKRRQRKFKKHHSAGADAAYLLFGVGK